MTSLFRKRTVACYYGELESIGLRGRLAAADPLNLNRVMPAQGQVNGFHNRLSVPGGGFLLEQTAPIAWFDWDAYRTFEEEKLCLLTCV